MLFDGRALIFTFSGTQVRIAEIERLQSLFKVSMIILRIDLCPCIYINVIMHAIRRPLLTYCYDKMCG